MAAIRPRDLLTDGLLGRLGPGGRGTAGDIAALAEAGYLNVALPPEFGGLGCTLRQAACGQRRLARHAPDTALAVSAHLYWTGAAADAYRAGDDSVRWILAEAARGALFAGGHGEAGGDLRFADPRSRCEPSGEGGYRFRDPGVLSTVTPALGLDRGARRARGRAGRAAPVRHRVRRARHPMYARRSVSPGSRRRAPRRTSSPTSALTWGHSILASVQYSDARRAFNDAITACAEAATPAAFADSGERPAAAARCAPPRAPRPRAAARRPPARAGRPPGRWPVAEAGALLDEMKAKIAEITHPWQLVQAPAPDLGGQHLISLYAMRHEVAEGAATCSRPDHADHRRGGPGPPPRPVAPLRRDRPLARRVAVPAGVMPSLRGGNDHRA